MKRAGIMLSEIAFPNISILFKNSGLQFFIIDCEHGGFDYSAVENLIVVARLIDFPVIIRLADNGRKDIVKFADMGADGFLLPMTNRAEDIREVVRYAKYRPAGERGISTMRAHTLYSPPDIRTYTERANARVKVYAQIETKSGVDNLSGILNVEGVDGCFVGPNDLSDDLGCLGETASEGVLSAIREVGIAAAQTGKSAGIITGNEVYLSQAGKSDYTMFCVGSELNAIAQYAKKVAERINRLE